MIDKCSMKNENAAALGRLNRGRTKIVSAAVTERRRLWAKGLALRRKPAAKINENNDGH